ncbi:MAG: hypothetical protein RLN88_14360 [Ekhidna sp.]|uniref:hypothetical protein n=1 Tax=Ekhidna sp. TaxID=2608089 RepID=UPI0032ECF334
MDLKDHDNNLRIIGKIFIVIGLILVPISICTFFFVDMFIESDLWMEIREFDAVLFEIRPPDGVAYFLPTIQTISSVIFLISGYGLSAQKDWGKKFAIVPAVMLFFKFPIGTALGAYMIYAIHYVPKEEKMVNGDEVA